MARSSEPHHKEALLRMAAYVAAAPTLDRAALQSDVWGGELNRLNELVQQGRDFEATRKKLIACISDPTIGSAARTDCVTRHIASATGASRCQVRVAVLMLGGPLGLAGLAGSCTVHSGSSSNSRTCATYELSIP